jgi:hypothetical protein
MCVISVNYLHSVRIIWGGAVKTFLEFIDINGFLHHEFAPPGQSVTGHLSVPALQRFCKAIPH